MLICISICLTFGVHATEQPEQDLAVSAGCHSVDAAQPLWGQSKLFENASAVFLYETQSDTLLYSWNADAQHYPASLVKIMTALLVLENGQLDEEVTVSESSLNTISKDAISIGLQAGERICVEDLLYAMLVSSANDAAAVLAEYISGSQNEFVELMNTRAAELGCTGTIFTNAHGLHNASQVTTARDTCRILLEALKHDVFRLAFGAVDYTVPETNMHDQRFLSTNNFLMNTDIVGIYYDSRVTGGRTGVTTDGYRCIASTSQSGSMELVCIVLGSADIYVQDSYRVDSYGTFTETIELLDRAYYNYSRQQIIFPNEILHQYSILNGDCDVCIGSYDGFSAVLPDNFRQEELVFRYDYLPGSEDAPIEKGQQLGVLEVWFDGLCMARTQVFAMNSVPVAFNKVVVSDSADSVLLKIVKTVATIAGILLIITVIAFVCFAAVIFTMRYTATKRAQAKNKRRRNHDRKNR